MNADQHSLGCRFCWMLSGWGNAFVALVLLLQANVASAETQDSCLARVRYCYSQEEMRTREEIKSGKIPAAFAQMFLNSLAQSRTKEINAYNRGRTEARQQLAAGRLGLLLYGLPPLWQPDYQRLLRERLGIEARVVAGCSIMAHDLTYADGYNEIMMKAITAKFGSNALLKMSNEASSVIPIGTDDSPFYVSLSR